MRVAVDACVLLGTPQAPLSSEERARVDVALQWLAAGKVPLCLLATRLQAPADSARAAEDLRSRLPGEYLALQCRRVESAQRHRKDGDLTCLPCSRSCDCVRVTVQGNAQRLLPTSLPRLYRGSLNTGALTPLRT